MRQSDIEIRPITNVDFDAVMAIENDSFVAPWKASDLLGEINNNQYANILVITYQNIVVGFVDYWVTFESATICQIAIDRAYRGNKLSSMLLEEVKLDCYAKRVRSITLEVRKSNQNAIILYKNHGFKEVLVKPNYYTNGEDAIYMSFEVKLYA